MIHIYGKKQCPFCQKAHEYCEANNIPYTYYSLDDTPELRDIIIATGMRTVPCIFDGKELIGGYEDFVDWHRAESIFD